MFYTNSKIIIECLIIGVISAICCLISHKIIYIQYDNDDYSNYNLLDINEYMIFIKLSESRNNIIACFFLGALVHYIIKQGHLTEMYCRKVCYDDKCFMVCDIK